jgi:hypothetical protein
MKFIRGKLLYSLSVENFDDFIYEYKLESRSVQEQVLQLSCQEKQQLFHALQVNARPENRDYKYDFLFDNCTTRARDIVARNTAQPVVYKNILPARIPTFRDLIHSYLDNGHEYWSKLGIDILLGARLDKEVNNQQAMFLPDYLLKGFDSAYTGHHSLVSPPQTILQMPSVSDEGFVFTPMVLFSLLLLFIAGLTILKAGWAGTVMRVFDYLFFFMLGLAGLLLLFMWFGTDHKVCQNNFNLFWALPTHVIAAFFIQRKKAWVAQYFSFVFWISAILIVTWFFLPQQLNPALIPLVLIILLRSWQISKNKIYGAQANPVR